MVSVPARRQQVAYSRERGLSARRAWTLFSVARSALEYRNREGAKDAPVVTRMKELSAQYPRYGYRRIRIFIARDGHRMSPGRAHRLWQTARLQVPRKARPSHREAPAFSSTAAIANSRRACAASFARWASRRTSPPV